MRKNSHILFLAPDLFETTGGIQKVCRTIVKILAELPNQSYKTHALNDSSANTNDILSDKFRGFDGKKLFFIVATIMTGVRSSIVIVGHANLIAPAIFIKLVNRKAKVIMLAHGKEVWEDLPFWKTWFIKKHVIVWAVSDYTRHKLRIVHKIHQNVTTIHNSLDPSFKIPDKFNKPSHLLIKYNLSPDQQTLLTICRVNKYERDKGYDQIIAILPRLLNDFPNLKYLLCGEIDRSEQARLTNIVIKNNLQNHISFTGFIEDQELTNHYLLADIFILPSKKEGFGLVFIEAAACGCQIISGNTDGSSDALLQGKLGTMVNPLDLEELYLEVHRNLTRKQTVTAKENLQKLTIANFGFSNYQKKITTALSMMNSAI